MRVAPLSVLSILVYIFLIVKQVFMKNHYYLWGAGGVGLRALNYLIPLGVIDGIIDNDPAKIGKNISGLPVCGYDFLKEISEDICVIIAHFGFKEAEEQLTKDGIRHLRLADFVTKWYRENRSQNAIGFLDFPITTRCTLNCEACMQYMPYRLQNDIAYEELKRQLAFLFKHVSFVGEISIIGGEPFLHAHLADLINHMRRQYSGKIGSLVLTTNGTIIPDSSVLALCREKKVFISVSDYSHTLEYLGDKISLLEAKARNVGAAIERKKWSWLDPGKFCEDLTVADCGQTHMQLYEGKLWSCTLMAAGSAADFCKAVSGVDYFDLSQEKTGALQEFLHSGSVSTRTSQCKKCLYHQKIAIPTAVQLQ
jgi:organic radical activating enzyme